MEKQSKKKQTKVVMFFLPFFLFVFMLLLIGGALGGGLSNLINESNKRIDKLISLSDTVSAQSLTGENTIGHTFVGAVKIEHVGAFKASELLLSVAVTENAVFEFLLVQAEKNDDGEYIFMSLSEKEVAKSNERVSFTVPINAELGAASFVALRVTNENGKDMEWQIYTIAFMGG